MQIDFKKYQGTGNDFVMIDNRNARFPKDDQALIAQLCHRKFGIGADGLICLDHSPSYDFSMVYFNADGAEGSMCGNGGRCLVAFASDLGLIRSSTTFDAIDGLHEANIDAGIVSLKMMDVNSIEQHPNHLFLNTGSPHHVTFVENLEEYPVVEEGRRLRYDAPYFEEGSNINFVEKVSEDSFAVRTYERGVENETLSCGTGVTAVALAAHARQMVSGSSVHLDTLGGQLKVTFVKDEEGYREIYLIGLATQVFNGQIEI